MKLVYLKQSITTYHFKEHRLIKQKDVVTFPFHSSSTTSYMEVFLGKPAPQMVKQFSDFKHKKMSIMIN
jgi:hypothetical protein